MLYIAWAILLSTVDSKIYAVYCVGDLLSTVDSKIYAVYSVGDIAIYCRQQNLCCILRGRYCYLL